MEPLCSSTRPTLTMYGRSPSPTISPPGRPAPSDSPTPEPEHDLGALRHRVHPLDERALGRRVEAEGVGVAEGAAEHGQVQGGLVVRGRVEHRRHAHLADGRPPSGGRGTGRRRRRRRPRRTRRRPARSRRGRCSRPTASPAPAWPRRGARRTSPVEPVEVREAAVRRRVAVHGHAVDLGRARLEHVVPRDGVERAGRVDLGLPVRQGAAGARPAGAPRSRHRP